MKDYEHHPLASLFPIISAAEIKDLAADIKTRGLQSAIILHEGKILDGRHRYEACGIAGVKPRFETYAGDDPIGFVLAANLMRRHLNSSQRSLIAANLATMTHGGDRKSETFKQAANLPLAQDQAAETLAVSPRSVRVAKVILEESPKLARQVASGKISLHAAHQQVKEHEAKSEPVLDECDHPIPDDLQGLWERRNDVEAISREVAALKNKFLALQGTEDLLWKGFEAQRAASFCENIHQALSAVRLFAVCVVCQGRGRKSCAFCAGKGLISKFKWETQATREAKELRKQSLAMKGGKK